ncbi:hypothetical protein M513_11396 [Trichuris suis]|uniref:HTH CENPB-type domain-containing protein n=1 Tax=Trichuris suis TaxID=68888 RepID=A0A085LRX2_9BILA|nr:hypothetical protein M513_11396 [Trichuris suis]
MAERKESRELVLKEKVALIRFLETSSQRKTAERFHVSKTTVSNIQRRKREYLERYDKESGDAQRKRRRASLDQVSEAALSWFKQTIAANERISGPMVQEVARRFALEFGLTGFHASSGWLEKFKLRHKTSQKILCDESNEVPVEVLEDFIAKFRYFASGFKEEDIFNADECGLFFKAMPDRSLVLKGDKCKSGKLSKERFTMLLCASATGEKWKPLVIEVTSSSVGATSIAASINALDAVLWISSSWNKVQPEAIRKCFRRAGFVRDQEDDVELRHDSPTREAEIEAVDFADFVAIDDEVATSTEPDPQAIFQSILAEAGMSVEASSAGDDAEEESDDETEMV